MLTSEQTKHFRAVVLKAQRITDAKSWHIRVSGRQLADKTWCVGLIFGKKGVSEWLKIADVVEEDLLVAKQDYRAALKELTH